jgi:hypothetical protein
MDSDRRSSAAKATKAASFVLVHRCERLAAIDTGGIRKVRQCGELSEKISQALYLLIESTTV